MNHTDILTIFKSSEAILSGHFILSSGLHSDTYLQCAKVLAQPEKAEALCKALAAKVRSQLKSPIDLVVSPAMGGVVVGYEMGRQLGVPAIFCERENGEFTLRRGFSIPPKAHVLIVEDVVTTGKSSNETIECVQSFGGVVVAEACLINRFGQGKNPLSVPLFSLLDLDVKTYTEDDLPESLKKIPAIKPGSRFLKK